MAAPRIVELTAPARAAVARSMARGDEQQARQLMYVAVLIKEAHLDPSQEVPAGQARAALLGPYERRGVTEEQIAGWVAACDPPTKPSWDEVECFTAKVRAALKPRRSLGYDLAVIGALSFAAALVYGRRR